MKKIIYLLLSALLIAGAAYPQSTGCVISNKTSSSSMGPAANTVDKCSHLGFQQTTAGITISVPTPSNTGLGRTLYIRNDSISGSVSFTLSPGGLIPVSKGAILEWNGSKWVVISTAIGSGNIFVPIAGNATQPMTGTFNLAAQPMTMTGGTKIQNGKAYNSFGNIGIDFASGITNDLSGNQTMSYASRFLSPISGGAIFIWSDTSQGVGIRTNGILKAAYLKSSKITDDRFFQFPDRNGTLATEGYVDSVASGGGTGGIDSASVGLLIDSNIIGIDPAYINMPLRTLNSSGGVTSVNFDEGWLGGAAGISLHFAYYAMFDVAGRVTYIWDQRKFFKTTGSTSLNYETGNLFGKWKVQTGTSTDSATIGGVISDHFADSATFSSAEKDLYVDTLQGGTFSKNGDKIIADYFGTYNYSAASSRVINVYFGGNQIYSTQDLAAVPASISNDWEINVTIIRIASDEIRFCIKLNSENYHYPTIDHITSLDFTADQVLKITGVSSGSSVNPNDIIAKIGYVEYKPAH